jgi:hypothetical protein
MYKVCDSDALAVGLGGREVWEEGIAYFDLRRRQELLAVEKEELERDRKAFVKRCKAHAQSAGASQTVS